MRGRELARDFQPWTRCDDKRPRTCSAGETIQSCANMRFGMPDYQLHHSRPMIAAGKAEELLVAGQFISLIPK
jgi:hypothetical protein